MGGQGLMHKTIEGTEISRKIMGASSKDVFSSSVLPMVKLVFLS